LGQATAINSASNTATWTVDSGAAFIYQQGNGQRAGNLVNNGSIALDGPSVATPPGIRFVDGRTVSGNGSFGVATAEKAGMERHYIFQGTVAPGNAEGDAGKFTFGSATIASTTIGSFATKAQFDATSNIVWDLVSTGGVAGVDYDSFDLLNGSTVNILTGAQLQVVLGFAWDESDAYWQSNRTYSLFSTSAVSGSFSVLNGVYMGATHMGIFTSDGQNIQYTYSVIPEPSVWGLIFAGLAVCVAGRRVLRRRQG
jgi:hypothetical protein